MADALLLSSQRALPAQLQLNYAFLHPDLRTALSAVLAKSIASM
jgi:NAD dependent epimerase/dehydratase family enzyme